MGRPLGAAEQALHRRPFKPIGNVPPAEVEARYYVQLEETAKAA